MLYNIILDILNFGQSSTYITDFQTNDMVSMTGEWRLERVLAYLCPAYENFDLLKVNGVINPTRTNNPLMKQQMCIGSGCWFDHQVITDHKPTFPNNEHLRAFFSVEQMRHSGHDLPTPAVRAVPL